MDKWLPTGQSNVLGVERLDLFHYFFGSHFRIIGTLHGIHGVTIFASEITTEQTDEDGRGACADTLPLDTQEDFRDFHNVRRTVLIDFVFGNIAFAFLDRHLIAVGNLVANPLGNILCRGVEIDHIVNVLVVQLL